MEMRRRECRLGFDLGVGAVHLFLGKSDAERQLLIRTIGPVWDANEVWLIAGTTYAVIIRATRANQIVGIIVLFLCQRDRRSIRDRKIRFLRRSPRNLAGNQKNEKYGKQRIQPHEPKQCKQCVAGMHLP